MTRWSPMTRRQDRRFKLSLSDRTTVEWIADPTKWMSPTVLDASIVDISATGVSLDISDVTVQIPESMKLSIGSLECFVVVKGVSPSDAGARLHLQFSHPDEKFQQAVDMMVSRLAA